MEAVTMESIITSITTFFTTGVLDWADGVLGLIVTNPVVTIMVVCVPLCGLALGWVKRLLRV